MHRETRGMIGRETCLGYLASNLHLHLQKCVQASGSSYPVPLLVIEEPQEEPLSCRSIRVWRMLENARDAGTAGYPGAGSMSGDMGIDSGDRIHGLHA